MINPTLTYYLNSKVDELKNYYERGQYDAKLFTCEQKLLFNACFYTDFPELTAQRIDQLFTKILNDNLDIDHFVYQFTALIILQICLRNKIEDVEKYLSVMLGFLSHHSHSNRMSFSTFLLHLLDEKFNPRRLIAGYSFVDHIVNHSKENIRRKHLGNDRLFAMITFLDIRSWEKEEIFDELYEEAREYDSRLDFEILEALKNGEKNVPNSFFDVFIKTQHNILNDFAELTISPGHYKSLFEQLLLFKENTTNPSEELFYHGYLFSDERMQKFLTI